MATFLVERYWPGITAVAAEAVTASLAGRGMVVVETIVAASDEVCFWYVEAETLAEVAGIFRAAAVPIDRISPATALPSPSALHDRRRHPDPPTRSRRTPTSSRPHRKG